MKNKENGIGTFEELTEKILVYGDFFSTYMRGHLMIEFLYLKILNIKPNKYSKKLANMSHSKLISAMYDLQYIDENEQDVLREINLIRNEFAHNGLIYFPTVKEMKSLLQNSQNAFIEIFDGFSRGLTKLNVLEEIENSEIEILIDFFMEILYNLKCNFDDVFEEYHLS